MPAPEAVSDAELRAADGIYTTDPNNPHAAGHQLWGVRTAPSSQPQTAAESDCSKSNYRRTITSACCA